jgi:hypothetical protein
MLSRTERCSSEVSCVTMPTCAAQALLRDAGDVLAVDEDAAGLDVVQAQQQVDDRALAGARAADEADLLARPDHRSSPSITARTPP